MEMLDILGEVFGDRAAMMLALLVFLATAVLTFGIMLGVRARGAVRRCAAGIAEASGAFDDRSSLRASSLRAVQPA
jgi:tight adherence protein C